MKVSAGLSLDWVWWDSSFRGWNQVFLILCGSGGAELLSLAHGVIQRWWQLGEWGYPGFVKGLSKVRWDFSVVLSTFKLPYTEALMRNMKLLESFIIFFEAYTGILCNLWHFLLFIMNFFRWREKQLFPLRVSERKERKKRCCLFFVQLADSADDMPQNQRRLGSN